MTKRNVGTFDSKLYVVVFALLACIITNLLIEFVLRNQSLTYISFISLLS